MGMMIQSKRLGADIDRSRLPHRYWRLRFYAFSANVASVADVEFRASPGGPDLTTGLPVIQSGSWSAGAAPVFDNDLSSFIYNTGGMSRGSDHSVGVDFGAEGSAWPVITEVTVRNGNPGTNQGPVAMSLQYSDDNVTWFHSYNLPTVNWTVAQEARTFTKPAIAPPVTLLAFMGSLTDTGPFNTALTPVGTAAFKDGRLVFDGTNGYYQNLLVDPAISRFPWQMTIEVFGLLVVPQSTVAGIFNFGDTGTRLLMAAGADGRVTLYGSSGLPARAILSPTVPVDVKYQFDGTSVRMFVNGIYEGAGTWDVQAPRMLYLGADPIAPSSRTLNGSFTGIRMTEGLI
jgi:hypothetical protein